MNIKRIVKIPFFFIVFLLIFATAKAENQNAVLGKNQQTFTLSEIAKIDDAPLTGRNPSYTIYLPLRPQWPVEDLQLNLIIDYSPVLLPSSTLTLMIGDTPIDTIKLDSIDKQPISWSTHIPKNYLKGKNLTLRLVGFMKMTEDICQDIENEGNWLNISGRSTITYYFKSLLNLNLAHFPEPFIQENAPYADEINFVLPQNLNAKKISPYLNLANILMKHASWRGVHFSLQFVNDGNFINTSANSIVIGTPNDIDFEKIGVGLPFDLKNKQWTKNNDSPLKSDEGFIYLTTNPNNKKQALMIISANQTAGIATALENLRINALHYKANNPSLYIASPLITIEEKNTENTLSFKELHYVDTSVFGEGPQTINVQFELPEKFAQNPVNFIVVYSHSPFLSTTSSSYLTVELNGLPINGTRLKPKSADKSALEIILPVKQLKIGQNSLKIIFDLNLEERDCTRSSLSYAWGTIYNDSNLKFTPSPPSTVRQIQYYPYYINNQVLVSLPKDENIYKNSNFLRELIYFVASLNKSTQLLFLNPKQMTQSWKSKNSVSVALGAQTSDISLQLQNLFNQMVKNLQQTSSVALQSIDKNLFTNVFSREQQAGFIGLIPSPSDPKKSSMLIYGFTPNDLISSLALINNAYRLNTLSGDIAVSFENDTYTGLSSKTINEYIDKELSVEKTGQLTLRIILFSLLGLMILGTIIYSIHLLKRNK